MAQQLISAILVCGLCFLTAAQTIPDGFDSSVCSIPPNNGGLSLTHSCYAVTYCTRYMLRPHVSPGIALTLRCQLFVRNFCVNIHNLLLRS